MPSHSHLRGVAPLCWALACAVTIIGSDAFATSNQGTGDVGGDATALSPSNVLNLTTAQLALVKRAFLTDGTPVAEGASVPKGTLVRFMMYIDNATVIPVSDMSVRDVLAGAFQYQAGTIKVDNSRPTGDTEANIYAAVNAQTALSDGPDGDVASIAGSTIDIGNQYAANGQLDILGGKVWAVLFTVKMQ